MPTLVTYTGSKTVEAEEDRAVEAFLVSGRGLQLRWEVSRALPGAPYDRAGLVPREMGARPDRLGAHG